MTYEKIQAARLLFPGHPGLTFQLMKHEFPPWIVPLPRNTDHATEVENILNEIEDRLFGPGGG